MYCTCNNKYRVKSEAYGKSFEVCSKNSGGCGKEIVNNLKNTTYKKDNDCLNCDGSGVKLRRQYNGLVKPETCKRCRGSGVEVLA